MIEILPAQAVLWSEPRSPKSTQSDGHIPALDGLRGLAILLVLVHHQTIMKSTTVVDQIFTRLAHFGWCGVDLFFVLSGFLITGILYDSKGSRHYFRNFYARRTVRIFPLYYGVVFFSLVILPQFVRLHLEIVGPIPIPEGAEKWYWLYLSNFWIASQKAFGHGILDISWSLAIEEQFYLIWAPLVWCFSRRALVRTCLAVVATALVVRSGMVVANVHPIAVYVITSSRLDALAIGALIALVARGDGGFHRLLAASRLTGLVAALAVLAMLGSGDNHLWSGLVTQTVGYTALALLFGSLLVRALGAPPSQTLPRVFAHPVLRAFGKYSYALYLFHLPLMRLVRDHFFGMQQFPTFLGSLLPGQLLFYVFATAPALLAAWLSWHLYEKHFLKLKRFFPYGRR